MMKKFLYICLPILFLAVAVSLPLIFLLPQKPKQKEPFFNTNLESVEIEVGSKEKISFESSYNISCLTSNEDIAKIVLEDGIFLLGVSEGTTQLFFENEKHTVLKTVEVTVFEKGPDSNTGDDVGKENGDNTPGDDKNPNDDDNSNNGDPENKNPEDDHTNNGNLDNNNPDDGSSGDECPGDTKDPDEQDQGQQNQDENNQDHNNDVEQQNPQDQNTEESGDSNPGDNQGNQGSEKPPIEDNDPKDDNPDDEQKDNQQGSDSQDQKDPDDSKDDSDHKEDGGSDENQDQSGSDNENPGNENPDDQNTDKENPDEEGSDNENDGGGTEGQDPGSQTPSDKEDEKPIDYFSKYVHVDDTYVQYTDGEIFASTGDFIYLGFLHDIDMSVNNLRILSAKIAQGDTETEIEHDEAYISFDCLSNSNFSIVLEFEITINGEAGQQTITFTATIEVNII